MCRQLDELRQSIAGYAGHFDARSLTPSQAGEVVQLCTRIEASVGSLKALAAARSAEGDDWKADGFRSPADALAQQSGTTPSAARRTLETGRRLADQPDVAQAALTGQLSIAQTEAVAAGAEANPAKMSDLLDMARRSSLPELHEEVAKVKATATDQEARYKQQHARRSLRRWTDLDGALQAHLTGIAEDGPRLWRMLDPIRRRLNILRRDGTTPDERLDALDYDALLLMADIAAGKDGELALSDLLDLGLFPQLDTLSAHPSMGTPTAACPPLPDPSLFASDGDPPGPAVPDAHSKKRRKKLAGSPARVMIRIDFDALLRGVALDGELCEIAGYGPVPVAVVDDILASESPFLIGLLTKAHELSGVYHHGRHPNAHQRSALDFLYPSCAAQGCNAKAGLQYDHRIDWSKTHYTLYDLLDRLCPHHHRLKTQRNWALVAGTGKRPFVPPDDSRHPRFSHCPSPPTAADPDLLSDPDPPGGASPRLVARPAT